MKLYFSPGARSAAPHLVEVSGWQNFRTLIARAVVLPRVQEAATEKGLQN